MSGGNAAHERLLARLELYAAARAAGQLPPEAAVAAGVRSAGRYERWYKRERLGLPARWEPGRGQPWPVIIAAAGRESLSAAYLILAVLLVAAVAAGAVVTHIADRRRRRKEPPVDR